MPSRFLEMIASSEDSTMAASRKSSFSACPGPGTLSVSPVNGDCPATGETFSGTPLGELPPTLRYIEKQGTDANLVPCGKASRVALIPPVSIPASVGRGLCQIWHTSGAARPRQRGEREPPGDSSELLILGPRRADRAA